MDGSHLLIPRGGLVKRDLLSSLLGSRSTSPIVAATPILRQTFTHANQSLISLDQAGGDGESDFTNLWLRNRAMNTAPNVLAGSASAVADQTGYDGKANGAHTLTDGTAAAVGYVEQTYTVANDSEIHWADVLILKDAITSRFPAFRLALSGGSAKSCIAHLNTQTGATTMESGSDEGVAVEDLGTWWRFSVPMANNGSGNTALSIRMYPARGSTFGVGDSAATGSIVCDFLGNFKRATLPPLPPLETAAAATTRYASTDADDTGVVQLFDDVASGSWAITGNKLVATHDGSATDMSPTDSAIAAVDPITLFDGAVIKATGLEHSANDASSYVQLMLTDAFGVANADRLALWRFSAATGLTAISFNPAGTVNDNLTISDSGVAINTPIDLAFVWEADKQRIWCLRNINAGGWKLSHIIDADSALTDVYADVSVSHFLNAAATMTVGKLVHTDYTATSVFAVSGYFRDLFDDTNGVLLDAAGHVSDSGGTWKSVTYPGSGNRTQIQSNVASVAGSAGSVLSLTDTGNADFVAILEMNLPAVCNGTFSYRCADQAETTTMPDGYTVWIHNQSNYVRLYSYSGGVGTQRGQQAFTITDGAHTLKVHVEGDAHSIWLDGGNKLSYSSATYNANTRVGVGNDNSGSRGETYTELYLTPLSGFDAAMDAF